MIFLERGDGVMEQHRRHFSAEQKAAILREHLVDRVSVSDLCDRHGLKPTVFYRWQKDLFESLPAFFELRVEGRGGALERENEALRARLAHKDRVIAQIMEDFIEAKKTLGGR
jgi:transposase-like protein